MAYPNKRLTGCAITFYDELDTLLNPDLRTVARSPASAPVETVLAQATAALPGSQVSQIDLPDRPTESLWLLGRAPRPVQIFSDPADGGVLGWRVVGELSLDRRHLMDVFYGLHIDLLIAPWVTWVFGLAACFGWRITPCRSAWRSRACGDGARPSASRVARAACAGCSTCIVRLGCGPFP